MTGIAFTNKALAFMTRQSLPKDGAGRYRYAAGCLVPTLYSPCYAAMTPSLLGKMNALTPGETAAWNELNLKGIVDYHRNRKLAFGAIQASYA